MQGHSEGVTMDLTAILIISVILGVDAFSLSLGIGLKGVRRKQIYLVSLVIAVFHIFMPLIGLYLGITLGHFIGPIAGKIGALVLIFIGAQGLWQKWSYRKDSQNDDVKPISLNSPVSLILMALSVSLDALTVGFSLGTLKVNLVFTVITMGIVAGIMTFMGFFFGTRLSHRFGENAEIIGSLILIIIGVKLFYY